MGLLIIFVCFAVFVTYLMTESLFAAICAGFGLFVIIYILERSKEKKDNEDR